MITKSGFKRIQAKTISQRLMPSHPYLGVLAGTLSMASMLSACDSNNSSNIQQPQPPVSPVAQPDSSWKTEIAQRRTKIEQTINQDRRGFEDFDTGSLGDATLEMIPYVLFRILQELEPTVFGDQALNSFGFFTRKDVPSGLNGVTWTRPIPPISPEIGSFELRYFTRSCASCHTGRVRLDNAEIRTLYGSTNTEIRLHYFVGQLTELFKARLADSNDSPQYQAFKAKITALLAQKDPAWYWRADSEVSLADAKKEVEIVSANIDAILTQMRAMNNHRLETLGLLQKYSYDKVHNPPSLVGGAPGIVETAGLGSASLIPVVGESKADLVLPPGPSKADVPSVWKLDPTGYANWDGTVKGYSRALTSSLAVVGKIDKIDFQANKEIQAFLFKLPPEPFPFKLDIAAIKRGESLYKENCLVCHDPSPGRTREAMVFDVQSDPARAMATLPMAAQILQKVVSSVCPQDQECVIADPTNKRGYTAGSLAGIWAQAPYLHNGSVPTLRQLLVPSLRTSKPFLRGSISYDVKEGGWEWDPAKEKTLHDNGDTAISLHDITQSGMGNSGHGSVDRQFVTVGNAKVRIAWMEREEDKKAVDDLIAYLLSL